jgi:hypothetical protein
MDGSTHVTIEYVLQQAEAELQHPIGLARLFLLQDPTKNKYCLKQITKNMGLLYIGFDGLAALGENLLLRAALETYVFSLEKNFYIRSKAEFLGSITANGSNFVGVFTALASMVNKALVVYQAVAKLLQSPKLELVQMKVAYKTTLADIQHQLAILMPENFIALLPVKILKRLDIYLTVLQLRLSKILNSNISATDAQNNPDAMILKQLAPYNNKLTTYLNGRDNASKTSLKDHRLDSIKDANFIEYWFLLEEYRVALFAQTIKTTAVSVKKLDAVWLSVLQNQ